MYARVSGAISGSSFRFARAGCRPSGCASVAKRGRRRSPHRALAADIGAAETALSSKIGLCRLIRPQHDHAVLVGQLVELIVRVEWVGRSSMTVNVDGVSETLGKSDRKLAIRGSFKMVAVDQNGRPRPIAAQNAA